MLLPCTIRVLLQRFIDVSINLYKGIHYFTLNLKVNYFTVRVIYDYH